MTTTALLADAAEALACHQAMLEVLASGLTPTTRRSDRAIALRDLAEAVALIDAALALR